MKKICVTFLLLSASFSAISCNAKAEDSIVNNFQIDSIVKKEDVKPLILSNLAKENLTKVEYSANLLNYDKDAYNYLIFYKLSNEKLEEIYRIRITASGMGEISDKKLLDKLEDNSKVMAKVLSFKIASDGKFEQVKYSANSHYYYTAKVFDLAIKEDDKTVANEKIKIVKNMEQDKVELSLSDINNYKVDDYYTYDGAKLKTSNDSYVITNKNIYVPYTENSLKLELAKNNTNWKDVSVKYPTSYKEHYKTYTTKKLTTVEQFLKTNSLLEKFPVNNNYQFVGYYIDDKVIDDVLKKEITENIVIQSKFKTKIVLDNGVENKEISMLTMDSLSTIDTTYFNKEKYNIVGYSLIDKESGELIKEVSSLNDEKVDKSIIIKAKYEEKTNKLSIRQDDYNKRFGKVDDSIKDKDITWKQTEKLGNLFSELRTKIKANSGYEVVFRNNRKELKDDDYISEDMIIEIYFKKIDSDWITVKFSGNGIDKFLSDGQEILKESRLENYINLPSATGETTRELLGWKCNEDYLLLEDGNRKQMSKDSLISTDKLGSVFSEKGKNLQFTAVYRKIFQVQLVNANGGSVTLAKNNNILSVDEGDNLEKALENNRLIILANPYYSLSHFIADKAVTVIDNGEIKLIAAGEKITEDDLYNVVSTDNLKITPVFNLNIYNLDIIKITKQHSVGEINDMLGISPNKENENLRKILGPLYYLR